MFEAGRVLIVDDSRTMVEVLKTLLAPLHREVLVAVDLSEARAVLAANGAVDLVIVDLVLPDGTGFDLLREVVVGEGHPEVILITARWQEADRARALEEGALDYLGKPISLSDLRRAWNRRRAAPAMKRAPRLPTAMDVTVGGSGEGPGLVRIRMLNFSRSGAFLATAGPLPIGTSLELEFEVDSQPIHAAATVVRVQQPSWTYTPGVGVRFSTIRGSSQATFGRLPI